MIVRKPFFRFYVLSNLYGNRLPVVQDDPAAGSFSQVFPQTSIKAIKAIKRRGLCRKPTVHAVLRELRFFLCYGDKTIQMAIKVTNPFSAYTYLHFQGVDDGGRSNLYSFRNWTTAWAGVEGHRLQDRRHSDRPRFALHPSRGHHHRYHEECKLYPLHQSPCGSDSTAQGV